MGKNCKNCSGCQCDSGFVSSSFEDHKIISIHQEKHPLAGKTVCVTRQTSLSPYIDKIWQKNIKVIDWYDRWRSTKQSWKFFTRTDSSALVYLTRTVGNDHLRDNEVIKCQIENDGEDVFILLHNTEIKGEI